MGERQQRGRAAAVAAARRLPTPLRSQLRKGLRWLNTFTDSPSNSGAPDTELDLLHSELESAYHQSLTGAGFNNSLADLSVALVELRRRLNIRIIPVDRLTESSGHQLGVRVDCCNSLSAAVACAQLFSRRGVPATFFLNHNSNYWHPEASAAEISRLQCSAREMALSGMRIGLHNDVWALAAQGNDPETILRTSLEQLRASGIPVTSIVSHNSAWSYGLESSRVFTDFGVASGTPYELQPALTLEALELTVDASFPDPLFLGRFIGEEERASARNDIRSRPFLEKYTIGHPSLRRLYDYEIWLIGHGVWFIVDFLEGILTYPATFDDVLRFLDKRSPLTQPSKGVLVIHPEYVSSDIATSPLGAQLWRDW